MNIQWYPGHMTKARRALEKQLKLIDMVVEVVDARAPKSTRNPDFDELFSAKERMFVLNKEDMANPEQTKRWLEYYRNQGFAAVSFSAVTGDPKKLQKAIEAAGQAIVDKYAARGMQKTVRMLVAGIPNVGKSAIINRLAGRKRMTEANRPGVTRGLSWLKLTPYMEFMDSPGMLWPKIDDDKTGALIALLGSIRQEILDEEALAYYLLSYLKEAEPHMLIDRYKLDELPEDTGQLIEEICEKRGFLMRGGVLDLERGYRMVLEEFRNGKMGHVTLEVAPI